MYIWSLKYSNIALLVLITPRIKFACLLYALLTKKLYCIRLLKYYIKHIIIQWTKLMSYGGLLILPRIRILDTSSERPVVLLKCLILVWHANVKYQLNYIWKLETKIKSTEHKMNASSFERVQQCVHIFSFRGFSKNPWARNPQVSCSSWLAKCCVWAEMH